MNRTMLVAVAALLAAAVAPALACRAAAPQTPLAAPRPNVVLVMTDDQGYGDLGFTGNPVVRTPNLDAMGRHSARMETFYVSPVCAPTRAALMTGRYCQRTRAIDTWIGRAMMEPAEVTVAEVLRDAGYATGIFGKWHLGDCYPMRPMDQGFEHSLVHRGGGIGQPSDPEGGEGKYTDPVLFRNDERVEAKGYCTDVYFDEARNWMREEHDAGRPFFAYIATNAPHGPFHDVPPALRAEYASMDLSPARFPAGPGHALPEEHDADRLARIFAMITNIDDNIGRLFTTLEEMGELENTLVLYLVDNGPNTRRYVAGMQGMKSWVHEGGVRSPFFAHWPARLRAGATSNMVAAHIDVMPTILDACNVPRPVGVRLDGRSLLPLLEERPVDWFDRTVVIQAHRGNEAVRYHHFLARNQRWKLLNASGFGKELEEVEPHFELYDMAADPLEQTNVADAHPEIVRWMRADYDAWFDDVSSTRHDNYAPPRIVLGSPNALRSDLTRQDWRRTSNDGGWNLRSLGFWEVDIVDPGPFRMRLRLLRGLEVHHATVRLDAAEGGGKSRWEADIPPGATEYTFDDLALPLGSARLTVELEDDKGIVGAHQVIVSRAPAVAPEASTTVQVAREMTREVDGHRYRYLLHVPADDAPPAGWPLVLFLHGAGERGDDIELVKVHGPPKLLATNDALRGSVLVSPQCPTDSWWRPGALAALVEEVLAAHPTVDRDRLYVTGLSMGGYGTWGLLAAYPDLFAAAVPICGGGDPQRLWEKPHAPGSFRLQDLRRAASVPIHAFHGQADPVVPVEESSLLIRELRAAGGDPQLTIYPGVHHDSWTRTYADPEVWRWLFAQQRRGTGKPGNRPPGSS